MQKLMAGFAGAAILGACWIAPVAAQTQGTQPGTMHGTQSGTMQQGTQSGTMQQGTQPGAMQQGTQPGQSQAGGPRVLASGFTAQVTGQVSRVDKQSGRLTLSTSEGPITVKFPPMAVQNVNQGDQVTVAFGLMESNPSASPGGTRGSGASGSGTGTGSSGSPTRR
jgi:hypothetical protein